MTMMFKMPASPEFGHTHDVYLADQNEQVELLHRHVRVAHMEMLSCVPSEFGLLTRGDCPTWWKTDPDETRIHACQLCVGHASPHVDLRTGDVKLGHEQPLCHVDVNRVSVYARRYVAPKIMTDGIVPISIGAIMRWWRDCAPAHDHLACGVCPREVW